MVMTDVVVKYIYEGHDDYKYICCFTNVFLQSGFGLLIRFHHFYTPLSVRLCNVLACFYNAKRCNAHFCLVCMTCFDTTWSGCKAGPSRQQIAYRIRDSGCYLWKNSLPHQTVRKSQIPNPSFYSKIEPYSSERGTVNCI